MPRTLTTVVVFGLAACATPACFLLNHSCTLVGCSDDGALLTAHLYRPKDLTNGTITVCLNAACTTYAAGSGASGFPNVSSRGTIAYTDDGWTLVTLPRFSSYTLPVHDGDRYAVRIVSATGAVLLDVERVVTYDRYYPNGEACGGACVVLTSAFYETSKSGLNCSGHPSTSEAMFTMTLDDATAWRASFTVCRNKSCNTIGPGNSSTTGPLDVSVGGFGPPGPDSISVLVRGEAAVLRDGDHYRVTVVDSETKAVLKSFDGPVSYETSFPNGEACDVYPSRKAHIAID